MTSQPPQTPPSPPLPANDDAATAIAATTTTTDNNTDHDLGPVTKLAAIAAAQAEADRIKQRKAVQASLQAHATLVGETAMAIAAATQHQQQQQKSPSSPSLGSIRSNNNNQHANANAISMSPIRLSPKQKESLKKPLPGVVAGSSPSRSPGRRSNNNMNSNVTNLNNQQQQQQQLPPKMSVAARARAAADLPTTQPRQDLVRRSSNSSSGSRSRPELGSRAPSSGNAGVSRGKFSKQQVKQMIDEWGETSEDEDDDYDGDGGGEYSDEYYQVEGGGGVGNTDRLGDEQLQYADCTTPNTKAYSHLQYTMSNSPGPKGSRKTLNASSTSMSHEEDEDDEDDVYHYQHHKVSSYSNYTPPPPLQQHDDPNNDNDNESSSGGILASAKNWLQSQRDRLHQMELERQVEDQRRKLVEEGRKERALEAEKRYRHRYYHGSPSSNSSEQRQHQQQQQQQIQHQQQQPANIPSSGSFGCMAGEVGIVGIIGPSAEDDILQNNDQQQQLQLQQQQNNNQTLSEGSGGMALCGFGGMYSNTNQLLLDDSTDYSGVARIDSQGNILEMIPSGSFDTDDNDDDGDGMAEGGGQQQQHHHHHHMKVGMKVSSPKCTLSGQGMSVNVDLPDVMPCPPHEKRKEDDYQNHNQRAINNALDEEVDEHDNNNDEEEDAGDATDDEDDPYFNTQIKIVPEPPQDEITGSAPILQVSQMKALISSGGLPPSLNFCKWKRLYNLTRDGDSFETFLRLVAGHERTVMVVKTTRGQLFGGYADTRWEARHVRQHAFEFYGSAQACLFRFPNSHHGKANGKGGKHRSREDKTIIYKWSGANRYIQLCDAAKRTVAFGGGGNEGEFGLCIEDDFRRGTTGHCSTFMNEALCEEGYFDVMDLEVWGFTLDF